MREVDGSVRPADAAEAGEVSEAGVVAAALLQLRSMQRELDEIVTMLGGDDAPPHVLRWRNLEVDLSTHRVCIDGSFVMAIAPLPFAALAAIMSLRPGELLTWEQLQRAIYCDGRTVATSTVATMIATLRRRLLRCGAGDPFESERGVGLRLRHP